MFVLKMLKQTNEFMLTEFSTDYTFVPQLAYCCSIPQVRTL